MVLNSKYFISSAKIHTFFFIWKPSFRRDKIGWRKTIPFFRPKIQWYWQIFDQMKFNRKIQTYYRQIFVKRPTNIICHNDNIAHTHTHIQLILNKLNSNSIAFRCHLIHIPISHRKCSNLIIIRTRSSKMANIQCNLFKCWKWRSIWLLKCIPISARQDTRYN